MVKGPSFDDLLRNVNNALALLAEYENGPSGALPAAPLPSLLAQCEAVLSEDRTRPRVRSVHHFACTGGTVICKLIGAMPNTVLLSEIDPLSTMSVKPQAPTFMPTDLIAALRHSFRGVAEQVLVDVFLGGMGVLCDRLRLEGRSLVVRDHAHSQFCVKRSPTDRPSLHTILGMQFDLLSIVTVRHPLDSYASLVANNWHRHFEPSDLETYAGRYGLFLDAHADLPIFKFEDFVQDPSVVSAAMCRTLELPWSATPQDLLPVVKMSGDSGRSTDVIAPRARREISDVINKEALISGAYHKLCARLGYEA